MQKIRNPGRKQLLHKRSSTRAKTLNNGLWRKAQCVTSRTHDQGASGDCHRKEDGSCSIQLRTQYTRRRKKAPYLQQAGVRTLSSTVTRQRKSSWLTAVLHALEDVRRADSGDTEELFGRSWCRSVVQTGCKYEPGVGVRYDVRVRPLRKRRCQACDGR